MALKTPFIFCLLLISLLPTLGVCESVVDFCVANLSLPKGPAGYPCRNPSTLTVNDFVYSGLRTNTTPVVTISPFDFIAKLVFDSSFPALNGLGLSCVQVEIAVNSVVPLHTVRESTLLIMTEGTVISGFIDSNNTPYYKILNKGDIMIIPSLFLRFQKNIGSIPAVYFASSNSANPSFQFLSPALFGNDLPTNVIQSITLIIAKEVQRQKGIFGGCN